MWCDRAALVLATTLSIVDEHRGWILERFGPKGARFLRYADGLSSLVDFYFLGRVAVAAPKMLMGLRDAYLEMRATRAALSAEEKVLLDDIGGKVEGLLKQVEKAGKGADVIPIEQARQPKPPVVEQAPLRATGTDARLVELRDKSPAPVVASAGDRGPKKPLNPVPPASQGTRATGTNRAPQPNARATTSQAEIAAALVRRGIPETQARKTAGMAADHGVLDKVEKLVKSPGYRNPENLGKFLDGWNPQNEGKIQALDDALTRLRGGHEVALEGGGADVVDYTTCEAIQHKRIFGESERAIGSAMKEAARQLRGEKGEFPPRRLYDCHRHAFRWAIYESHAEC
jgi:hypothetical protein